MPRFEKKQANLDSAGLVLAFYISIFKESKLFFLLIIQLFLNNKIVLINLFYI